MPNNPTKKINKSFSLWLRRYALILYTLSLFMVGIDTFGIVMLCAGTLIGWLYAYQLGILAVYANIPFFIISYYLGKKTNPSIVIIIIMLGLASLTFFYQGMPWTEGLIPAETWGLGVFFWGLAIILMAVAAYLPITLELSKKYYYLTHCLVSLCLLPFITLAVIGYKESNSQERSRFFPPTSVFSKREFSHIKIDKPSKSDRIPTGKVIEVRQAADEIFPFPLPAHFQKGNYSYKRIHIDGASSYNKIYKLQPSYTRPDYLYQIKSISPARALITATNLSNNQVHYRQEVKKEMRDSGYVTTYPHYEDNIEHNLFYNHILSEPRRDYEVKKSFFESINSLNNCPAKSLNDVEGAVQWEGQVFQFPIRENSKSTFLCTPFLAIYMNQYRDTGKYLNLSLAIFRRDDMLPLIYFRSAIKSDTVAKIKDMQFSRLETERTIALTLTLEDNSSIYPKKWGRGTFHHLKFVDSSIR